MSRKIKKALMSTLLLGLVFFGTLGNVNAQIEKYEALYVYNISRYVEWSESFNSDAFVIGIVGNNPELKRSLEEVTKSKNIQGKKVTVKYVTSPSQGGGCNIVFVSKGSEGKINSYRSVSPNSLVISESKGGLYKGSDLNFFLDGEKLKFELSQANIDKKSLNVSGSLVKLAAKVI